MCLVGPAAIGGSGRSHRGAGSASAPAQSRTPNAAPPRAHPFHRKVTMGPTPWLLLVSAALVVVALVAAFGAPALVHQQMSRRTAQPGWWAPAEEQERLRAILERNPTYDETTGLTSDRDLARWMEDNQP